MKKLILSVALLATSITALAQVGVGTTDPQASLDIQGNQGMLLPRMADHTTLVPVDGTLDATEAGLQVYNTTTNKVMLWNGTAWVEGAISADNNWVNNATDSRVELSTLSDGTTARPAQSQLKIYDNGTTVLGNDNISGTSGISSNVLDDNAGQFFASSLDVSDGDPDKTVAISGLVTDRRTTGTGNIIQGLIGQSFKQGSYSNILYGANLRAVAGNLATGSTNRVTGAFIAGYGAQASGNITNLSGATISGNFSSASGSVTNMYGAQLSNNSNGAGAGSISNSYALYIDDRVDNSVMVDNTDRYAIYQTTPGAATSKNYFKSNVGIDQLNPEAKLDVNGYIKLADADATADAAPTAGLLRYNGGLEVHDGTAWSNLSTAAGAGKFVDGTDPLDAVYTGGNVGIGTSDPVASLEVHNASISPTNGVGMAHFIGTDASSAHNNSFMSSVNFTGGGAGITKRGGYYGIGTDGTNDFYNIHGLETNVLAGLTFNEDGTAGVGSFSGQITNGVGVASSLNSFSTGSFVNAHAFVGSVRKAQNASGLMLNNVRANHNSGGANIARAIWVQANSVEASNGTTNEKWALYIEDNSDNYIEGNVGIGTSTPGSKLAVVGLPVYADNAAATGAGLAVGDFYRTATGQVMVRF